MDQNKINKLKELSELYKEGILTKEEVEVEKNKILSKDETPTENKETNTILKENEESKSSPKIDSIEPSQEYPSNEYDNDEYELKEARKKKLIYGGFALLILIGIGVFIGLYQHRQNQIAYAKEREQFRRDSIAEAERLLEIQRRDSIIRNFSSPDLKIFNLHGKIKAITGSVSFPILLTMKELQFDEKGNLIGLRDSVAKWMQTEPSKIRIQRDKKGYITKISDLNDYESYNFIWNNERLVSIQGSASWFNTMYNINIIDNFVRSKYFYFSSEEQTDKIYYDYDNYEFDKYGNWITCHYTTENISIQNDGWGETDPIETTTTDTGKLNRNIEYYQ